jgi:hypothetical protein
MTDVFQSVHPSLSAQGSHAETHKRCLVLQENEPSGNDRLQGTEIRLRLFNQRLQPKAVLPQRTFVKELP